MSYTDILHDKIMIQNRKEAGSNRFGKDADGAEWEDYGLVYANVDFARGKRALNAGAIDAYAVKIVRMRWHSIVNMRSRIVYNNQQYAIIPETFHADYRANRIQFNAQLLINETPTTGPIHGSDNNMDFNNDF